MSQFTPSLSNPGPNLADVLARIPQFAVSPQARQNMASAIRALARVLDRDPGQIPIHAPTYRKISEAASPGSVGLSDSRWRNVRSDVNRAIRLAGLSVTTKGAPVPLTPAWEEVVAMGATLTDRHALRRFARFCCGLQCPPSEVSADIVECYRADLERTQLARSPATTVRTLLQIWRRSVAGPAPDRFPCLPAPAAAVSYGPGWEELPVSLLCDALAFREASLRPPLFEGDAIRQPITPFTALQRHRMIRRIAAAEVLSGINPGDLRSLADVVAPERLKLALQFFIDRNQGEPSVQAFEMAYLALTIARRWASLSEDQVALLDRWVRKLRRPNTGMTEKNRDRLRQFTSLDVIQRILTLPDRLLADARKKPLSVHAALTVQKAVAIGILTTTPIRVGNLGILDRREHFRRAFSIDDPRHHMVIPARLVKNDIDLEFPVPDQVMTLIDLYMERHQPLLANGHPTSLLFPGRMGQPKELSGLRKDITAIIRKKTGLHMNAHLFRHFAAFLFLKANPGQYEAVRQLLGHKRIETTINFYASFETDAAMHQFNRVIEGYRESPLTGVRP